MCFYRSFEAESWSDALVHDRQLRKPRNLKETSCSSRLTEALHIRMVEIFARGTFLVTLKDV